MSMPESGTIIEGFGDEVVLSLGTLVGACLFIAAFILFKAQRGHQTPDIDPANQATVDSVRDVMSRHSFHQSHESRTNFTCPICLDQISYAVETNCGHMFCGLCMVTYWHTGNWISGLKCPVDRREVTILLKYFTPEEVEQDSAVKSQIEQEVNLYNRRFSGQPLLWSDWVRDLPTLLYHCFRDFFSPRGLVLVFRIRIVFLLVAICIYFLSPFDIIPESVFGVIGFLDDIFLLFLMAIYISILYRRYVEARALADLHGHTNASEQTEAADTPGSNGASSYSLATDTEDTGAADTSTDGPQPTAPPAAEVF